MAPLVCVCGGGGRHLFYTFSYRETLLKFPCLKLEDPGLWYLVCNFI